MHISVKNKNVNNINRKSPIKGCKIITPKNILNRISDYNNKQLRPKGSRQPLSENSILAKIVMKTNGMSSNKF